MTPEHPRSEEHAHPAPFMQLTAAIDRLSASPAALRAWFRAHSPGETQHLFGLTLLVGVVCGFAAVAFHLTIRACEALLIDRAMAAPGSSWMVWTIVTPTVGGLCAGALLTWLVPGARGSGIPQVKVAYATEGGRVRFRDAVGKFVLGALQIGSGASLGREGPTVQICAGAASLLARITALPPRNMRRLTPVGVAAGIAAAFNAPIAAVTFTIEEIVGTLDNTVLSGVVVAAALAAVIERGVLGVHPVIQVDQRYGLEHASSLATYALLGLAAGVVSVAFTDGLLKLRLWFRGLRWIPGWAQPGVGGLVTGCLAVVVLSTFHLTGVTGGGYDTLGRALAGSLGLRALMALCAIKLVATVFSYSSGGAGGIFAPSLFMGAMLGGAFGYGDLWLFGPGHAQLGGFALVGMGAVFAGVVRAPITSVLIIFEMTGSYGLVLPLMLANMTAYALARSWRSTSVYEALLEQDGIELPHAPERVHALEQLRVADAMTTLVRCLSARQTLSDAAFQLEDQTFTLAPVTDERGAVLGSVTVDALRRALGHDREATVQSLLEPVPTIRSDEPLLQAMVRMTELGVRQLCVVNTRDCLVGIVAMSDVVRAHARLAPAKRLQPSAAARLGPELRAGGIMRPAVITQPATKLSELQPGGCFLVPLTSGYGALFPEDLASLAHDENFQTLLSAGDAAQPAAAVALRCTLQELARALHETNTHAAVVYDAQGYGPIGIVSRADLANALLEWFTAALPTTSRHVMADATGGLRPY